MDMPGWEARPDRTPSNLGTDRDLGEKNEKQLQITEKSCLQPRVDRSYAYVWSADSVRDLRRGKERGRVGSVRPVHGSARQAALRDAGSSERMLNGHCCELAAQVGLDAGDQQIVMAVQADTLELFARALCQGQCCAAQS